MPKSTLFANIPRQVWALGWVSLFTDISSEAIISVLPLFLTTTLGASVTTVGLIEGIAEATASVLKVFSGAISDYWGQRKSLAVLGYGLSTFVKPLFAIASSPSWVLLARFADRAGKGIRAAPRDALVADVTDASNRGAAYGLRQSLDTIGALLGPLLAMVVLDRSPQNFRLVFWLAVIPGIIAVMFLVFGVKEPRQQQNQQRVNPLNRSALSSLGSNYWWLLLAVLIFNLGNSSDAFLLLKAQQVGIPAAFIPLTLVVQNLTYALFAYPLGRLSDRISRRQLLIGGWLIYALVYGGLALVDRAPQFWGLLAVYGVHLAMTQGTITALVADLVPANLRGTAFGFLNLAVGVALFPASLLAGLLWQQLGSGVAFAVSSGLALIAICLLAIVSQNKDRSSQI